MNHDEAVKRLIAAAKGIPLRAVAEGFVASLGSAPRRYRSALASYALAAHLEPHERVPYGPKNPACRVCGVGPRVALDVKAEAADLEESGTVLPGEVLDAIADLETFRALPRVAPTDEDWAVLNGILATIAEAEETARSGAIEKALARARLPLGANKYARRFILESLSHAGVLETEDRPGLLRAWSPYVARDDRPSVRVEVGAPLAWWTRRDGLRADALRRVFADERLAIPAGCEPKAPVVTAAPRKKKAPRESALAKGDVALLRFGTFTFAVLTTNLWSDKGGVYPLVLALGRSEGEPAAAVLARARRRAAEKPDRTPRAIASVLSKRQGRKLVETLGRVAVAKADDLCGCPWVSDVDELERWAAGEL